MADSMQSNIALSMMADANTLPSCATLLSQLQAANRRIAELEAQIALENSCNCERGYMGHEEHCNVNNPPQPAKEA